jgi:uncharacterized protein
MKTSSKKNTSQKEVAKPAVAKKSAPAKKVAKKSSPAVVTPAPKKVAKKSPSTKTVTAPKVTAKAPHPASSTSSPKEWIKMLGILHLVGNIVSGGLLGIILVVVYYMTRKNTLSSLEKETCFEIINFNLSFMFYTFISGCLIIILIGLLLLPAVLIAWFVLMIMGFMKHIAGENYQYPLIIRFLS